MTLTHILVFCGAALLYLALLPARWRQWALFIGSVIAIFWLQPAILTNRLDFLFPTLTLALVTLGWLLSREPDQRITREDIAAAIVMIAAVVFLAFGRYLQESVRITASKPPPMPVVGQWLGLLVIFLALINLVWMRRRNLIVPGILFLLVIFVALKTEAIAEEISRQVLDNLGQPTSLASAAQLEWLGFSYVAFRLIHTLRDRQSKRLPALNLREYTTYAIFFPAFTAGPIDRAERFLPDLRDLPGFEADRITQGSMRIAVGIGKKFIIADSLSYFALNATNAEQVTSAWGLWVLTYAYAFQIYFDFSGYSDIAIGIGQLFGIKLPENFNLPYLKRNITLFWQSWHITLSQWVRFYVFSPLSRYLLTRKNRPSPTRLALIGQITTMIVIGLWHGVTWGFVVWGLWHGIGLFIHKVYSDRTRKYYLALRNKPRQARIIEIAGVLVTFHFVVLGWVWFALPDIALSWEVFLGLFGI